MDKRQPDGSELAELPSRLQHWLVRGSLNSAHIRGTDVPVKEPSRASRPEVVASFDHLVGTAEQHRWYFEAKRFGGLEIDNQLVLGGLHHW